MITIEQLAKTKNHFPRELIEKTDTAICFFTAAFHGYNDVIDFYRKGNTDITLVDLDKEKLDIMRGVYPKSWNIITADAFETAKNIYEKDGVPKYDIVVCDPWSAMVEQVLNWKYFYLLSKKYYVVTADKKYFDKKGIKEDLPSVIEVFPNVVSWMKRSGSAGGTYWLIMKGRG